MAAELIVPAIEVLGEFMDAEENKWWIRPLKALIYIGVFISIRVYLAVGPKPHDTVTKPHADRDPHQLNTGVSSNRTNRAVQGKTPPHAILNQHQPCIGASNSICKFLLDS